MTDAQIQPVNIAENTAAEHQSLADRLYSVFHGVETYVLEHLPAHTLKDTVLSDIRNGWHHTVEALKGDLAQVEQSAKNAAQNAVSEVAPTLEHAAEDAASSVAQTAETVAADATNVTPSGDAAAPSESAAESAATDTTSA